MNEVEWTENARDQLADIWIAATPAERIRFEGVLLCLAKDLVDDPLEVGESRSGSVRVVVRSSLVIWFNASSVRPRIFRITRSRQK